MDIYAEITSRIINQMEQGIIPWQKPWIGSDSAISHTTSKPYSLLNQMLLGEPGEYLTYKQCVQEGGHVRKSEKARMVVFWKSLRQEDEETGEIREIPYLKYYNVFHISQCEGIAPKNIFSPVNAFTADEAAESIISLYLERSAVKLHHKDIGRAFYSPADDSVILPQRSRFKSTAAYYTVFDYREKVRSDKTASIRHYANFKNLIQHWIPAQLFTFQQSSSCKNSALLQMMGSARFCAFGAHTTISFR